MRMGQASGRSMEACRVAFIPLEAPAAEAAADLLAEEALPFLAPLAGHLERPFSREAERHPRPLLAAMEVGRILILQAAWGPAWTLRPVGLELKSTGTFAVPHRMWAGTCWIT